MKTKSFFTLLLLFVALSSYSQKNESIEFKLKTHLFSLRRLHSFPIHPMTQEMERKVFGYSRGVRKNSHLK